MKPRVRIVSSHSAGWLRERLYALIKASRAVYPHSKHLRHGWIRARLALGNRQPSCKVGREQVSTFARSTPQARPDQFSTLAPRTMREAGL